MKIVYFSHSLTSCWNHGNAHFVRGVLGALQSLGHDVTGCEPEDAWSRRNLLADHGPAGLLSFEHHYPSLPVRRLPRGELPESLLDEADLVIAHEWNDAALIGALGRRRARGASFTLLFHDTHHRAVSDPQSLRAFDLSGFDGVLAFGETLAAVYRRWGWGRRAFVWHEAADTRVFRPPAVEGTGQGLVWIGNWGDDERREELERYLFRPAAEAGLPLTVHGVRYPPDALALLARYGVQYRGWLANPCAPEVFAQHLATVHVPRRYYARALPGIPTIRVFEALACGIPLVSAPWEDSEQLFRPGRDFLVGRDGDEAARHLRALRDDPALRRELVESGLQQVRERHTCTHRARELLAIVQGLAAGRPVPAQAVVA